MIYASIDSMRAMKENCDIYIQFAGPACSRYCKERFEQFGVKPTEELCEKVVDSLKPEC